MLHILLLAVTMQSVAATPTPGIAGPRPTALSRVVALPDTTLHHAVVYNWQEPALVGAAVLGGLSDLFVYGFCTDADTGNGDACVLPGEAGFLFGGLIGGGTAGLIGSSSHPAAVPPGYAVRGNRGSFGALMLGVPSAFVNAVGFSYYCNHQHGGCSVSNLLSSIIATVINAGIGELIGRSIPRFEPISPER